MTKATKVSELTLMDRVLFSEAIENKAFAEDVQSIILGEDVFLDENPVAEKEIRNHSLKKYIKLDVWMVKEDGEIIDTEVQNLNTGCIPKRSRLYQAMIDSKQLLPGETDYNELKNVKIIIIASFDLFGQGKYCYKFQMCEEDKGFNLEDGAQRVFLNTKGRDPENISDELRWMLLYFEQTTEEIAQKSGSERIMRMHRHIETIRNSEEFSFKYLRELEDREYARKEAQAEGLAEGLAEGRAKGLAEGRAKGLAEGRAEEACKIARKLKEKGMSIEAIEEMTELNKSEIEAL